MNLVKLIPLAINVGPDLQALAQCSAPLIRLAHQIWPELEPILKRILSNPEMKEFLASVGASSEIPTDPREQVVWLQTSLTKLGFPPKGGIDGIFGTATLEAMLKLAQHELRSSK